MRNSLVATVAAISFLTGMASAARADVDDTIYDGLSYTVGELDFDVTNFVYAEEAPDFVGYPPGLFPSGLQQTITWRLNPPDSLSAEGPDDSETLSVLNAFAPYSNVTGTIAIGVASNLPGDEAPGEEHLVLFVNDAFAQAAQGVAWSTLFPNTDEAELLSEVDTITTNLDMENDYNGIFDFLRGDAYANGLFFAPGDSFTVIAFTDGDIIGTGVSALTDAESSIGPTTPIPEPSTWVMLATGFLGLAGMGLGRKREPPVTDSRG